MNNGGGLVGGASGRPAAYNQFPATEAGNGGAAPGGSTIVERTTYTDPATASTDRESTVWAAGSYRLEATKSEAKKLRTHSAAATRQTTAEPAAAKANSRRRRVERNRTAKGMTPE